MASFFRSKFGWLFLPACVCQFFGLERRMKDPCTLFVFMFPCSVDRDADSHKSRKILFVPKDIWMLKIGCLPKAARLPSGF